MGDIGRREGEGRGGGEGILLRLSPDLPQLWGWVAASLPDSQAPEWSVSPAFADPGILCSPFLFFLYLASPHSMWGLSSPPGD